MISTIQLMKSSFDELEDQPHILEQMQPKEVLSLYWPLEWNWFGLNKPKHKKIRIKTISHLKHILRLH
jgi:hypothetical protein